MRFQKTCFLLYLKNFASYSQIKHLQSFERVLKTGTAYENHSLKIFLNRFFNVFRVRLINFDVSTQFTSSFNIL